MDEKYHTWHKNFVYLPVYLTGCSSHLDFERLFVYSETENFCPSSNNILFVILHDPLYLQ